MANFEIAYQKTKGYEAGYANVAHDNGGETYAGISRKFWPKWEGWSIVDQHKPIKQGAFIKDANLERMVRSFYKKQFWEPIQGDLIVFQNHANTLYDFGVNSGVSMSVKNIQKIFGFAETGKVTDGLVEAINNPDKYLI